MNYLIMIYGGGKRAAVDRLMGGVDALVEDVTTQGGIDGLTTEIISGPGADAARDRLRGDAEAKRPRKAKT